MTADIDDKITRCRSMLDQLRNTDFVVERNRQAYFRAIAETEQELIDLLRHKESHENQQQQ